MKKIYKPIARAEKQSQIYRKKTLNLNDDLNIKHDDDNIENVEEYWNTALSVIGNTTADSSDHTAVTEVSDTLFNIKNIRQSIKSNKAVKDKENVDSYVNDTDVQPWNDLDEPAVKDEKNNLQAGIKELAKTVIIKKSGKKVEETEKELIKRKKISEFKRAIAGNSSDSQLVNDENIVNMKQDRNEEKQNKAEDKKNIQKLDEEIQKTVESIAVEQGYFSNDFEEDFNISETKEIKKESDKQVKPSMLKAFNKIKKEQDVIKEKPVLKTKTRVEKVPNKRQVNEPFVVENALQETPKNKIFPMVCSSSINTAVMKLDYLAYFDDFKTENSFSAFVLKGKVKMSVNGQVKTAGKGDITIIEKDDVFSLNCVSKNGAKLLVFYAL